MILPAVILFMLFLPLHSIYSSTGPTGPQRQFTVYDYVNDRYSTVVQLIDPSLVDTLKNDLASYTKACIECEPGTDVSANMAITKDGLERVLGTWPMMKSLADQLREISGSDDELFANLVLQVVHQLKFYQTDNIKFPMVTIADGIGDCDNLSTLAATIMKAGGLDSVVVVGKVPRGCFDPTSHAMVGVQLSEPPDTDAYANQKHNPDSKFPHTIDHNFKTYYLAEGVWNSPEGALPDVSQYDEYAGQRGAFVGENPQNMSDMRLVAETPDSPSLGPAQNIRVD